MDLLPPLRGININVWTKMVPFCFRGGPIGGYVEFSLSYDYFRHYIHPPSATAVSPTASLTSPFPWVTAHSNCDYHQQPQTTKCSHSTHTLRRIPITSMLPPPPTLPLSKRNPISVLSVQTHKLSRRGRPQMELCAITRKKGIGKSSCHCIILVFTCSLKTI